MDKLDKVIEIVKGLYDEKNPVIDWNEWIFEGHYLRYDYKMQPRFVENLYFVSKTAMLANYCLVSLRY